MQGKVYEKIVKSSLSPFSVTWAFSFLKGRGVGKESVVRFGDGARTSVNNRIKVERRAEAFVGKFCRLQKVCLQQSVGIAES